MKFEICMSEFPSNANTKQVCNFLTAGLLEFIQKYPQACHKMNLTYVLYYWCRDSCYSLSSSGEVSNNSKMIRDQDWMKIIERAIEKSKVEPLGDPKFDVEKALYGREEEILSNEYIPLTQISIE
jgi:hypothetical protein